MAADFEKQVTEIAQTIEPDVRLAPETLALTVESLEEVERKYGPDSDNYLAFHHAPHSIGSIRRGVRLANIFYPYISPVHRRRLYDLTMVGQA
ncbi:MAG TPA: hypothetical protein VHA37_05465, partial [Candidatus Saccharimonadales bacterium]|nr:hypothetical protein [Candidatus Saccharimonadales bacterium]